MLNEPASSSADRPIQRAPAAAGPLDQDYENARALVEQILRIDHEIQYSQTNPADIEIYMISPDSRPIASFSGLLLLDSQEAFARLETQCAALNFLPAFRTRDGDTTSPHMVHVLSGRPNPKPRGWTVNLLLLLLTVFTMLLVGAPIGIAEAGISTQPLEQCVQNGTLFEVCLLPELWRGLPYALSLLAILGAHELGHYFLARRHKLAVTLPYFIPFPMGFFGTMGAFIQLRQPMPNRKALLDVGAAGPLIGLLVAIPILLLGIATSRVEAISGPGILEGNSLVYALAKTLLLGQFYPANGMDMIMNQFAQAGWTGLFVTALNLIPIGQLDGGHTLYALIGKRARLLYYPLIAAVIGLSFLSQVWILWVILLFLFGRIHATPLDDITPLDTLRQRIGVLALIVFVVTFVPIPLTIYDAGTETPNLLLPLLCLLLLPKR
ncbi:MAG: site-2 protease family protein [Chloroflexi bacterium]|nr:site-2 protease family protein [Chloroflexota bacterium]